MNQRCRVVEKDIGRLNVRAYNEFFLGLQKHPAGAMNNWSGSPKKASVPAVSVESGKQYVLGAACVASIVPGSIR